MILLFGLPVTAPVGVEPMGAHAQAECTAPVPVTSVFDPAPSWVPGSASTMLTQISAPTLQVAAWADSANTHRVVGYADW